MSKDYVRPDGRLKNQLREFKVEVGVLDRSEGSAKVNLETIWLWRRFSDLEKCIQRDYQDQIELL